MVVAVPLREAGTEAVRFILCANSLELRWTWSHGRSPSEKPELYPLGAIRPSLGMRKNDVFSNLLEA